LLRGRIYIVGDGEGVVEDGVEEFKRPGVRVACIGCPLDGDLSSRSRVGRCLEGQGGSEGGDNGGKQAQFVEHS
jgi:hypothetical protein